MYPVFLQRANFRSRFELLSGKLAGRLEREILDPCRSCMVLEGMDLVLGTEFGMRK